MQLPDELNDDLRKILGVVCFRAGPIAHRLNRGGMNIPGKAEEEQAAVIFWLLKLYEKHGSKWAREAGLWLERIEEDDK